MSKKYILHVLGLLLLSHSLSVAQCGQERQMFYHDFKDSVTAYTLANYLSEAYRVGAFRKGERKGIVHLTEYTDQQSRTCWNLRTYIEDAYRDNLPTKWLMVGTGDIVLHYKGDSEGKPLPNPPDKEFEKCLAFLIADRVYQRVPPQDRYFQYKDERRDKWVLRKDLTQIAPPPQPFAHEVVLVFEKDGSISRR
jgi:hypothetical protein